MARFHDKSQLMEAGSVIVAEFKNKDFTSKAAVDAALAVAGCANDFRPDDDDTPGPFGANSDTKPVATPKTPAQAVKLAEKFEGQGFGAETDETASGGPALMILLALARFALERWLNRK